MKRYVCTVATGLLLALAGTATASANSGLPVVGQSATQQSILGDQGVGTQENDADVTQEQGNGNVNIAPAISVFGDAETKNEQGNGNTAKSEVEQENDVDQTQSSNQDQSLDSDSKDSSCCDGQSQAGEQTTYGGDQTVEKQENDADVTQKQGNDNVNIAPAISVFGDAETKNAQGNGNVAKSDVGQKNDVDQSQSSRQKQELDSNGDACCKTGQSQAGEQKTSFGDQTVGKQENDADVTQSQGNENVSYAPAHTSEGKEPSCSSECGKSRYPSHGQRGGDAETKNAQGNGNVAKSDVGQKNDVDQSQSSTQKQELSGKGGGCCKPRHDDSSSCDARRTTTSGRTTASAGSRTTAIRGPMTATTASASGRRTTTTGSPRTAGVRRRTTAGSRPMTVRTSVSRNTVDQSQVSDLEQALVQGLAGQ